MSTTTFSAPNKWSTSSPRQWKAIIRPAIQEDGSLWFPSRLTREHLDQEKATLGPYLFSAQYLLQYIAPEDRRFEPQWVQYFEGRLYPAEGYHTLVVQVGDRSRTIPVFVTTTVDPAYAEHKKADYTAIVTVASDPRGIWYVLSARRFRGGANRALDEIVAEIQKFSPAIVGIESISYQQALKEFLLDRLRMEELLTGVRELTVGVTRKAVRIEGLVPRFASKMVYLSREVGPELEREILGWSPSKDLPHDDLIDALSYQLQIAQASSTQGQRTLGGTWHDLSPEERNRLRKVRSQQLTSYTGIRTGYG